MSLSYYEERGLWRMGYEKDFQTKTGFWFSSIQWLIIEAKLYSTPKMVVD